MSSNKNQKQYQTASIRLSRIKSIDLRGETFGSGRISEADKRKIESEIMVKGVEYLIGDTQQYIIRLTKRGEDMYNSIFHLRPIFDSSKRNLDGNLEITITATEKQIRDYFFRFGKDAHIVSPEISRFAFLEEYNKATESYKLEEQNIN